MIIRLFTLSFLIGFIIFASIAFASELTIPNTFTAGSPAVAADVNANFLAVETAVDDNFNQIDANTDGIEELNMAAGVAAAGANTTTSLTATDTTVRTITINPPRDGLVLFTATAWFSCTSSTACVPRCSINPGGTSIDSARFAISTVPNGQYQTLSIAGNLPVTSGTALTLNMVCDTFEGSGRLGDANIIATFSTMDLTQ